MCMLRLHFFVLLAKELSPVLRGSAPKTQEMFGGDVTTSPSPFFFLILLFFLLPSLLLLSSSSPPPSSSFFLLLLLAQRSESCWPSMALTAPVLWPRGSRLGGGGGGTGGGAGRLGRGWAGQVWGSWLRLRLARRAPAEHPAGSRASAARDGELVCPVLSQIKDGTQPLLCQERRKRSSFFRSRSLSV